MNNTNRSKGYLASFLLRPLLGIALTFIGILLLVWATPISTAREKITVQQGYDKCADKCQKINKTLKSRKQCYEGCWAYWSKNGSDAPPPAPTSKSSPTPSPNPTAPPNATPPPGPTATPNPLKHKPTPRPPHKGSSPSPTPSHLILLTRPAPTPTPKSTPKKRDHHHG